METEFDLNPKLLHDILAAKGITNLYHANTFSTSITFLKEKSLLSRKYVEDHHLFQTAQYTDTKDKQFDIFDDIFLDAMDIHTEFTRPNKYGPFLFSFNLDILLSKSIKSIRITKMNPSRWNQAQSEIDWYYNDLNDFDAKYKKGNKISDVGSMFIFKGLGGKLPLRPQLNKFILDNPNLLVNYKDEKTYLANILTEEIDEIFLSNGFTDIQKELRHKHNAFNCSCWRIYNYLHIADFNELKKRFHSNP